MKQSRFIYEAPVATAMQVDVTLVLCQSKCDVGASVTNYAEGEIYDGLWN